MNGMNMNVANSASWAEPQLAGKKEPISRQDPGRRVNAKAAEPRFVLFALLAGLGTVAVLASFVLYFRESSPAAHQLCAAIGLILLAVAGPASSQVGHGVNSTGSHPNSAQ